MSERSERNINTAPAPPGALSVRSGPEGWRR
jgi:hypothetical protein